MHHAFVVRAGPDVVGLCVIAVGVCWTVGRPEGGRFPRVSAARSRSRGLEATSWAPEATWRTRSARFRGASRPPATVHVASTRPVATADEPVCNGPTSLMAICTAWLCRHMFRHLLQVNACAACAHRLEFEPWLDTSTLDPDTVRHHPTLRHQCQSTLDRHSARHSDTSVQPS